MKLNKQDLLMLWRFSQFESVREVAQNPDILKLILQELEPMFQFNRVVTRPGGSRLYSTWDRSYKCAFGAGKSEIGAISASRLDAGDGSRKRATSRWWRRGSGCARAMLSDVEALLMVLMEAG